MIISKPLALPLCFIGGYALNGVTLMVDRFVCKQLSITVSALGNTQEEYDMYTNNLLGRNRRIAALNGMGLDRILGICLGDFTVIAIREEISYRFLIETVILPRIFPQFAAFSITRSCVSSLLFAVRHRHNPHPRNEVVMQCFDTFFLGMICSLAQQKVGLVGAMFIHVGYNVYGWQYMFKQDATDIVQKLSTVHLTDVIHPVKIGVGIGSFVDEAIDPCTLAYQVVCKLAGR